MKKLLLPVVIVLVLLVAAFTYVSKTQQAIQSKVDKQTEGIKVRQSPNPTETTAISQLPQVKVSRVIDGDTIEIEGGQKVRYIGMDTPETVDPRKTVQCFGVEASNKNKELVQGKTIRLEKDVSETDKYGRLLRFVYVDSVFVNDYLVRQGFARVSTFPPDVKYQGQFLQAQQEAQQNNRGLWSSCTSNQALITQPTANQSAPNSNCVIKGNISTSGEKIYHMPGQMYYDKTVIDTSKGERWFCTENEAITAGWRKSKQ